MASARALRVLGQLVAGARCCRAAPPWRYAAASTPADLAEHDQFGQRVRAQPVGAVDAHAGAFAHRVQARQRRGRVAVGGDAAHGVVHRRQHRDRLPWPDRRRGIRRPVRRSAAGARAASSRPGGAGPGAPPRRAGRAMVRPFCFSCQKAWLSRSRGPSSIALLRGVGRGRAEAVVLQVAVAVLVEQEAAFAAAGLGEQQAGAGHAGRVVLHELHVAQRHAVAVGQRHAVAGDDAAVGVLAEHAAGAAGGDDHRLGLDQA